MRGMPSPTYYEVLLPVKEQVETPAFRTAGQRSEWFSDAHPSDDRRASRHLARLLIVFFLGAVAILVWQSYGLAARELIAGLSPELRWLAPQPTAEQTAPDRIEQITRSVDRIASDFAARQEQMTRSIDHLAAGQEQMTREIIRLQAISQYAPYKGQDPSLQAAPGGPRKAVQRASQAR